MASFTQAEIDALIICPKEVTEAPSRSLRKEGAHLRNDSKFVATDKTKGIFAVFIRKSIDFPENFSVGLVYNANDGRPEIKLLRCNGKHGVYNKGTGFDPSHPHWDFHIHRATEEALESGAAAEKNATATTEFASLEETVQYFVKAVNLDSKDVVKHFRVNSQANLDFGGD